MNRSRWSAIWMILAVGSTASAQAVSFNGTELDDAVEWYIYDHSAWKALRQGDYAVAEREFTGAINVARRPRLKDNRLLARSYADIAYAIQKQGRLAEAEPLAKWALSARRQMLKADAPPVIANLNQLGALYLEMGRFADAEPLLRQAVEVQQASKNRIPGELARSETLFGLLMVDQGKLDEAEPHFSGAIRVLETSAGPAHPETGDAVNNLAWLALERGKNDLARPLFDRALLIAERPGPSSNLRSTGEVLESTLRALEGLGKLNVAAQRWAEAQVNLARAVELREEMGRGKEPATAEALASLADVLERLGLSEEAAKTRAKARRVAPTTGLRTISRRFHTPGPSGVGLPSSGPTRVRS